MNHFRYELMNETDFISPISSWNMSDNVSLNVKYVISK